MTSEPTTPVRVPKAAATYTPTTQDPDLRSQINTVLLRDGHISKIQETLLHTLNASPTNWPTLIEKHALSLLRSGECSTFPDLMARVMEDIREDTEVMRTSGGIGAVNGNNSGKSGKPNGVGTSNMKGKGEGGQTLALPKEVVDEGVKATREALELVCEVE